jgi:hypothetical protein
MNNGFYGYPKRSALRLSTNTLISDGTYQKLLLASVPEPNSLQIWRQGVLTTAYTLRGREVTFTAKVGSAESVKDQYWTSGPLGRSSLMDRSVVSLYNQTMSASPLGYWPLNETSGTTAVDASGNGYDMTYTGSPTLDQTPIFNVSSRSVDFSGTSQYASYSGYLPDNNKQSYCFTSLLIVCSIRFDDGCRGYG